MPAGPVVPGPAADPAQPVPAGDPTGNRTARFAWGAVAVILVGVVVLVVLALTGPPPRPGVVHRVATSSDVIAAMAKVPASVFDSVGVTAPAVSYTHLDVYKRQASACSTIGPAANHMSSQMVIPTGTPATR